MGFHVATINIRAHCEILRIEPRHIPQKSISHTAKNGLAERAEELLASPQTISVLELARHCRVVSVTVEHHRNARAVAVISALVRPRKEIHMSIPGSHHSFRFKVAFVIAVALTGLIVFPFIFARSSPRVRTAIVPDQPQAKRKELKPDRPGTISGATDAASIPDTVAFELFMRSRAEFPSADAFQKAVLDGDEIARALSYLQTFEKKLSAMDQAARELRFTRRSPAELSTLERQRQAFLSEGLY